MLLEYGDVGRAVRLLTNCELASILTLGNIKFAGALMHFMAYAQTWTAKQDVAIPSLGTFPAYFGVWSDSVAVPASMMQRASRSCRLAATATPFRLPVAWIDNCRVRRFFPRSRAPKADSSRQENAFRLRDQKYALLTASVCLVIANILT